MLCVEVHATHLQLIRALTVKRVHLLTFTIEGTKVPSFLSRQDRVWVRFLLCCPVVSAVQAKRLELYYSEESTVSCSPFHKIYMEPIKFHIHPYSQSTVRRYNCSTVPPFDIIGSKPFLHRTWSEFPEWTKRLMTKNSSDRRAWRKDTKFVLFRQAKDFLSPQAVKELTYCARASSLYLNESKPLIWGLSPMNICNM